MSLKILLAALVVTAFSSCSTAYKSGQTPDDVYYSPVRTVKYEEEKKREQRDEARNDQEDASDREIRMRIRNPRWRYFDDSYGYNYNSYNPYCNCYCNQGGWGYINHPWANPTPLYAPPIRFNYTPTPPRVVNLGGYNGSGNVVRTYTNPKTGVTTVTPRYNNSNNSNSRSNTRGNGLGNVIREIFTPSSNNSNSNPGRSNSNGSNNTRTYEPSSSPSSSGSSTPSSSGGSVSRPGRGG